MIDTDYYYTVAEYAEKWRLDLTVQQTVMLEHKAETLSRRVKKEILRTKGNKMGFEHRFDDSVLYMVFDNACSVMLAEKLDREERRRNTYVKNT